VIDTRESITHRSLVADGKSLTPGCYYTPTFFRNDESLTPGSLLHTNFFSQMMSHCRQRVYYISSFRRWVLGTRKPITHQPLFTDDESLKPENLSSFQCNGVSPVNRPTVFWQ